MGIESKKECIYITDSLCCTAESNSTVKNDVTIKIKKKIKEWIKTHKFKNWKHRTSSPSHNFYNHCSLFWSWCFLSIYRILAKFPGGGADEWRGGKHSQCVGDRRQCGLGLAVLSRPPPGLIPTKTYCPPEHCLPRLRDIHSVIKADDLLHKHWHHREGSTCLKTIFDNVI